MNLNELIDELIRIQEAHGPMCPVNVASGPLPGKPAMDVSCAEDPGLPGNPFVVTIHI